MGQKIHPVGLRVGVIRGFDSHWYETKRGYAKALKQDHEIRELVKNYVGWSNENYRSKRRDDNRRPTNTKFTGKGNKNLSCVSRVEIERAANRIKVNIFTSKPGGVIGHGAKGIEALTNLLMQLVRKSDPTAMVNVNVTEVRKPDLDAQLVAEGIAEQLEKRVSHRRAMRQAMTRVVRAAGKGIKLQVGGRLNGAEIARTERDKMGKIPLHTIRADIDFGTATAKTMYGTLGVKVWIYNGEVLPEKRLREMEAPREERRERRRREDRDDRAFGRTRSDAPAPEGEPA